MDPRTSGSRLREWLPGLNSRKKWHRQSDDPGRLHCFKTSWQVATWTNSGNISRTDGHVRTVDVKVGTTVMRRPIVKLCPLERG